MEKPREPETPPPGPAVPTEPCAGPAVARSAAGIAAVSWVALTKVVVRAVPFQRTPEPFTKLLPLTVMVNAASPVVALVGDSDVSAGAGLVTENVWAAEVPPPGAGGRTGTGTLAAAARSAAGIAAVSWVALTKAVVRAAPFQRTVEPLVKPVPLTVSVKAAPPTAALVGTSPVIAGTGLSTGNACAAEVPPPGLGGNTVTGSSAAAPGGEEGRSP